MNMVGHQAECVDTAAERFNRSLQKQVKTGAVAVIEEDGLACVAAQDNVVNSSGIMDAGFACHAGTVTANNRKSSLTPNISKTKGPPKIPTDPNGLKESLS